MQNITPIISLEERCDIFDARLDKTYFISIVVPFKGAMSSKWSYYVIPTSYSSLNHWINPGISRQNICINPGILPRSGAFCSTVSICYDGCWNIYTKQIEISLFTQNARDFYMTPMCNHRSFNFSSFLEKIRCVALDAYDNDADDDASGIAREFYRLYVENIDFIEKIIMCKKFHKDIGGIIQYLFVTESQPLIGCKKHLQFKYII